jgi:hypothetical protein
LDPLSALLLMAGAIGAEGIINRKKKPKKESDITRRAREKQEKTYAIIKGRYDIRNKKRR